MLIIDTGYRVHNGLTVRRLGIPSSLRILYTSNKSSGNSAQGCISPREHDTVDPPLEIRIWCITSIVSKCDVHCHDDQSMENWKDVRGGRQPRDLTIPIPKVRCTNERESDRDRDWGLGTGMNVRWNLGFRLSRDHPSSCSTTSVMGPAPHQSLVFSPDSESAPQELVHSHAFVSQESR